MGRRHLLCVLRRAANCEPSHERGVSAAEFVFAAACDILILAEIALSRELTKLIHNPLY